MEKNRKIPPNTSDGERMIENLVEDDADPYDIDGLLGVDTDDGAADDNADPYDDNYIPDLDTAIGDGSDVYHPPGEPKRKSDDWDPDCVPPRPEDNAGFKHGESASVSKLQER